MQSGDWVRHLRNFFVFFVFLGFDWFSISQRVFLGRTDNIVPLELLK